jgi:hypothetical protein
MGFEMGIRRATAAGVFVLLASWASAADAPKPQEFARVEAQGVLRKFKPSEIRMPEVWWYEVTVGREKDRQIFRLDLANAKLQKLASDLHGKPVIVAGDLEVMDETTGRPEGNPRRMNVIRVKTITKVDDPKK